MIEFALTILSFIFFIWVGVVIGALLLIIFAKTVEFIVDFLHL